MNELIERLGTRIGGWAAVERIESLLEALSPRDRKLLTGLAAFFVVALLALTSYGVRGALAAQTSRVESRTSQLLRAQEMAIEVQALKSKVEGAEAVLRGGGDFIIQSFIEREAQASGITQDKLPSITVRSDMPGVYYKETVVEVELKAVSLDSLVRFLQAIEYGDRPVHVKALRVRTGRVDRNELDVDLELTVVSLNPGS